jgi:hypothetical protein
MEVLAGWDGRLVLVVAFIEPGFSLRPFEGRLAVEPGDHGIVRAAIHAEDGDAQRIAFPVGLFHEAGWVPGHDRRALSVVQGATRVDVFLED